MLLKEHLDRMLEVQAGIERGRNLDELWDVAQSVVSGGRGINRGNWEKLNIVLNNEIAWSRWWLPLPHQTKAKLIGHIEDVGAWWTRTKNVEDLLAQIGDNAIVESLGEERIRAGRPFVSWVRGIESTLNLENGHVRLAKRLDNWCVFHAWKSNDPGVAEMVWEKRGRRWEWMVERGLERAGKELILIGKSAVGNALVKYQDPIALYLLCRDEMESELRDVLEMVPISGSLAKVGFEDRRLWSASAALLAGDRVFVGGSLGLLAEWQPVQDGLVELKRCVDTKVERRVRQCTAICGGVAWWSAFHGIGLMFDWSDEVFWHKDLTVYTVRRMLTVDDGKTLLLCDGGRVTVVGVANGNLVWDGEGVSDWGEDMSLVDNDRVVVGGDDGQVGLVNFRERKLERKWVVKNDAKILRLLYLGEGDHVLTRHQASSCMLLDMSTGESRAAEGIDYPYASLGDDRVVVSIKDSGDLVIWSWKRNEVLSRFGAVDPTRVLCTLWNAESRLLVLVLEDLPGWFAYRID